MNDGQWYHVAATYSMFDKRVWRTWTARPASLSTKVCCSLGELVRLGAGTIGTLG